MSKPVRPRRSVLYMPGSNARALDKARTLPADGYILRAFPFRHSRVGGNLVVCHV